MTAQVGGDSVITDTLSPPAAFQELLLADEAIILIMRPSPWFILLDGSRLLIAFLLSGVACAWLAQQSWTASIDGARALLATAAPVLGILAIMRVSYKTADWMNRLYVLTDRRVLSRSGILRLAILEVPLSRVQNSALYARALERVLGLGSIGFATAGGDGFEMVWSTIAAPAECHRRIQTAIERYGRGSSGV